MKRREYVASVGSLVAGAGCLGGGSNGNGSAKVFDNSSKRTSEVPTIDELPDLSGELTLYLGRGEGGLYRKVITDLQSYYSDLTLNVKRSSSSQLANVLLTEDRTPADAFISIDAGSLGAVAEAGIAADLPKEALSQVPDNFAGANDHWVGIAGRARSIPYNTDKYDESEIPDDIMAFDDTEKFRDDIGWAPPYGSFQSFVTAMRIINGDEKTRRWLRGIKKMGVTSYSGEFSVTNSVAEGEIGVGLANHYYTLRLKQAKPDAPLELAFTSDDAGSLINTSGGLVLSASDQQEMATNLIRHFHTRGVQQHLTKNGYEYPLVPGVEPAGNLPPISQLNPPDINLSKLSNLQPTLKLLRDTEVL